MLSITHLRGYGSGLYGPTCPGDLIGPATELKPDGECYWVCSDTALDPRFVTGGIAYGNVCFPMYGGEKYGAGHPNVLGEFKSLQRAINDFISARGLTSPPPLIIDGQIGPNTLQAFNAIAIGAGVGPANSTADLALRIYMYGRLTNEPRLAAVIAAAANKLPDTEGGQLTSDNRPKGQSAINPVPPAVSTMPIDPSKIYTKRPWGLYALGAAAFLGIAAIAISSGRHRDEDEALFPETV